MSFLFYRSYNYRVADLSEQRYFRGDGILFWIYAVVTSRTGSNLPVKGKKLKKIPKEIDRDLSLEERAAINEAIENGSAWFFSIEGEGWEWRERNGAEDVERIQATLEWLYRFDQQSTVDGSQLLYLEVNNKSI
jgi:hypothetical protein